jgi:hypothetical protein
MMGILDAHQFQGKDAATGKQEDTDEYFIHVDTSTSSALHYLQKQNFEYGHLFIPTQQYNLKVC